MPKTEPIAMTNPAPPPDWQRPMLKIAEGDGDFLR